MVSAAAACCQRLANWSKPTAGDTAVDRSIGLIDALATHTGSAGVMLWGWKWCFRAAKPNHFINELSYAYTIVYIYLYYADYYCVFVCNIVIPFFVGASCDIFLCCCILCCMYVCGGVHIISRRGVGHTQEEDFFFSPTCSLPFIARRVH